jgi:imidazolonepropionase-like amidohydrolase
VKAADLVRPEDRRLEQARSAGFTTAITFPRQGLLAGHGAVVSLAGATGGRMVIHPSAGLFTSLQGGVNGFPATPMGVMAYMRQLWIDAAHYEAAKAAYQNNPSSAVRPAYDRALDGVKETGRLLLPAVSRVQLERMARFSSEFNLPAILYGGHEAFQATEALKRHKSAVIVNVRWPEKPREADPAAEDSYRELELRDKAPATPAALAAAGIPFGFTSDGLTAPRELLRGVKRAIDAGLKPEDAIRALTLWPAEIFGVADRLGSIEPGKIANLTVVKGDPFAESARIEMVIIDGVKYMPVPEAQAGPPGARPAAEVRQ